MTINKTRIGRIGYIGWLLAIILGTVSLPSITGYYYNGTDNTGNSTIITSSTIISNYTQFGSPSNVTIKKGTLLSGTVNSTYLQDNQEQIFKSTHYDCFFTYSSRLEITYIFKSIVNASSIQAVIRTQEFCNGYATSNKIPYQIRVFDPQYQEIIEKDMGSGKSSLSFTGLQTVQAIEIELSQDYWFWDTGYENHLYVDLLQITMNWTNQAPVLLSSPILAPSDPTLGMTIGYYNKSFIDPDEAITPLEYHNQWERCSQGQIHIIALPENKSLFLDPSQFMVGDRIRVSVWATDSCGAQSEMGVSNWITIANRKPVLSEPQLISSETNSSQFFRSSSITCLVTVTELDPVQPKNLFFQWLINGNLVVSGTSNTFSLAGLVVRGDFVSCQIIPNDGIENGTTKTVSVLIENSIPYIPGLITLSPDNATTATTLTVNHAAPIDLDGDVITIQYTWWRYRTGQWDIVQTGSSAILDVSFLSYNDKVYVMVSVNDGLTTSECQKNYSSTSISISNSIPYLNQVELYAVNGANITIANPALIDCTSMIYVNISCGDFDPQPLCVNIQWFADNALIDQVNNYPCYNGYACIQLNRSIHHGQNIFAYVQVSDGVIVGQSIRSNTILIQNSVPIIHDAVFITKNGKITAATHLAIQTNITDADHDCFRVEFEWSLDGVINPYITGSIMPNIMLNHGQNVSVRIKVYDIFGGTFNYGPEYAMNSIIIANNHPEVVSFVYPMHVASGEPIFLKYSIVDHENDAIIMAHLWRVNNQSLNWNASYLLPAYYHKGDLVTCTLLIADVFDHEYIDPITTAEIVIENTAPVLQKVDLPIMCCFDESLVITPIASDFDGDVLTYTVIYYRNDEKMSNISDSDPLTLSYANFAPNDLIYAVVMVSDGNATDQMITTTLQIHPISKDAVFDWQKIPMMSTKLGAILLMLFGITMGLQFKHRRREDFRMMIMRSERKTHSIQEKKSRKMIMNQKWFKHSQEVSQ